MKLSRKLLVRVALAVVGAAILTSVSVAATRPDDRAGVLGAGAQPVSPAAAHPDNRVGVRGIGETLTPAAAHPDNRTGVRGVQVVADEPGGTDWTRVGIGVGIGAAVLLVLVAAFLTMRHGGHRPHRPIPTH